MTIAAAEAAERAAVAAIGRLGEAELAAVKARIADNCEGPQPRPDIAERLGFDRPRDIRQLIARNLPEIEGLGLALCRTAPIESGKGRVTEVAEYWLNEEQALLVAVLSRAPNAPAVRAMLIRVFTAYRRGQLAPVGGDLAPLVGTVQTLTALVERQAATIADVINSAASAAR